MVNWNSSTSNIAWTNISSSAELLSFPYSSIYSSYDLAAQQPKDIIEKKQDPKTFYENIQMEINDWLGDW